MGVKTVQYMVGAIIVILVLFALYERGLLQVKLGPSAAAEAPLPYKKKDYFFTAAERSFYQVLLGVLEGQNVHVFAKVRTSDLLYLPAKTAERQSYQNRIQPRHIDFVVCDKKQIAPLIAIELDDSSHSRPERVARDQFVEKAFADAGLPLLRFPVKSGYVTADLAREVIDALGRRRTEVAGS